ncbi:glycosyltransferase family 39 protein [Synechococcus elongatus IITB7]|uniref:ArnT family glycosyltransferase n=1 Tax=Synechococcus elongatus TaxID=32046 RepID=UPI0030CE20A5
MFSSRSPLVSGPRRPAIAIALGLLTLAFLILIGLGLGWPNSLMAHDEGYYALQARWILETGDWWTPRWWQEPVYDRTIGVQWLIAASYKLFGFCNSTARLPAMLSGLATLWLTFAIGDRLLPRSQALLAAGILLVTPLWFQYAQLATQDMPLLAVELLAIWGLLQAVSSDRRPNLWGFVAGLGVGLGFLIKGFMIGVPLLAIAPWFFWQAPKLLRNRGLWLGLVVGWIPVGIWLWGSQQQWGNLAIAQLFEKFFFLANEDLYSQPWYFYLWNLPLNAFPWPLFGLIGWVRLWLQPERDRELRRQHQLLLGVYPLLLLIILSSFRTRTPYYLLQLLPWVALLAAMTLSWLATGLKRSSGFSFGSRQPTNRWVQSLSWAFGGLGLLLMIAAIALRSGRVAALADPSLRPYGWVALALGLGWLTLPWVYQQRQRLPQASVIWYCAWLLGPWLGLATVNHWHLLTDRSPATRYALEQPAVQALLQEQAVDFWAIDPVDGPTHQQWIQLALNSPRLGQRLATIADRAPGDRVWVAPEQVSDLPANWQHRASMQGWLLVEAVQPAPPPPSDQLAPATPDTEATVDEPTPAPQQAPVIEVEPEPTQPEEPTAIAPEPSLEAVPEAINSETTEPSTP